MKILSKVSIALSIATLIIGLAGPAAVFAATTPSLGATASYAVLANTYTNTVPGTTITGDIGFTTGPAVVPGGVHLNYGSGAPYATAGTDQVSLLSNLNSQACTFTFASGAIDLATDTTHGPIGVYTPGVYCTSGPGAASIGTGGITLSGAGTFIFRINGALTTVANSVVTLAGPSVCDVFWTPTAATTLGANSTFRGTNVDASGITLGNNVSWIGRALAFGGTVTTAVDDTITVPTCTTPVTTGTLQVIKHVINDNGGTLSAASFVLHVNNSGSFGINDVTGSPAAGAEAPGTLYTLTPATYIVSENAVSGYASTFSGACDANGSVTLSAGTNATCTVTNNDIAAVVVVSPATLHVIKTVVNNNGGTAIAALFNLHVKLSGTDVSGSPAAGVTTPGRLYTLTAGTYNVSEDTNASYAHTFSGACDANGNVTLSAGADATCTITNDDIAAAVIGQTSTTDITAPTLPKTGMGPVEQNKPLNFAFMVGLLLVTLILRAEILKSRAISS